MATATVSLVSQLNKQVANWGVLFIKLHNYHWFVKGNQFFTLHGKFEQLYNDAAGYIDLLAERVLSLQGRPPASMAEFLEQGSVKEAKGNESANQMVEYLVDDFNVVLEELKSAIQNAEEIGDQATADLLTGIRTALEKEVWMLTSFLA